MPAFSINNVTGQRFIELLSVDSTNNYAMQQVQKVLQNMATPILRMSKPGKGRLEKQWFSEKDKNIILSVVLDMRAFQLSKQFQLSMIAALSALKLFNKYTTEKIKIKWPNDIYYNDRKAAGILIENSIRGKTWQFAITGFGINVNQTTFPDSVINAVSLKQITGENYNVVELAKELCVIFENNFHQLFDLNEQAVLELYNSVLYKQNQIAKFKQGSEIFSGLVKGVNSAGKLIIKDAVEHAYETGSVEWVHE